MIDKEALRSAALNDSKAFESKRRFGLFNQPISTAVGDDGPYKTKLHPRDPNGKPISKPRNFQSGPCMSGQMRKSYFSDINSLADTSMKDQYIDPERKLLLIENKNHEQAPKNQNKYKPASKTGSNILWKPTYEYVSDKYQELDPKRNRESDGRVKTRLRNTMTNPGSKVINSYFKPIKYMNDQYDRAHQQEVDKMKKDKSLELEVKFKPNHFNAKTFHSARSVYGSDVEAKEKNPKQTKFNIFKHQMKWKVSNPNKHGLYGYFTPFPDYKENPPREITRRASQQKKQTFKSMNSTLTAPSSSITKNPMNMRKNISHSISFRKY